MTALISGAVNQEIISINDFSATLNTDGMLKGFGQYDAVNKLRDLICSGKIPEAELLLQKNANPYYYKFIPRAKIVIQSNYVSRISKYRRELRLDKAVHKVTFCSEGKNYTRESFVSGFAQVFAMRINCDKMKSINFTISLESKYDRVFMMGNSVCISGDIAENSKFEYPATEQNVKNSEQQKLKTPFLGALSVKNIGGTIIHCDNKIKVIDADEAIIYFSMRTKSFEFEKNLNTQYNDFSKQCFADIHYAQKLPYFDLINQSILKHKENYGKCYVSLEDERFGRVSTDIRMKRHMEGQQDLGLYPLMYNMGKYIAMTCSQYSYDLSQIINGGVLPKESSETECKMKFWPVYSSGLFECYMPFLKLFFACYENGKVYAKEEFHIDGWLYNYQQEDVADYKTKLSNTEELNFWRVSSGWMSLLLWRYYKFNCNKDYLNKIYPIMQGAAAAFKQLLLEQDGSYILPPSALVKPGDSKEGLLDYSITIQLTVYQLFKAVSEAQDILNIKNEYNDLIARIKISDMQVEGIKCDCDDDVLLDEYSLHLIQLTGAYDFETNQRIKKRIQNKVYKHGALTDNLCTLGWKVGMCATLHDGEKALEFLDNQLSVGSQKVGVLDIYDYYNRFVNVNPVFSFYSSMAVCSGILNMLIQFDDDGNPQLIPAIPKSWKQGKVSEIKIPGNRKISFSWDNGKVTNYKIENVTEN